MDLNALNTIGYWEIVEISIYLAVMLLCTQVRDLLMNILIGD